MNPTEQIRQVIRESREEILGFLKDLVECNSYVHNKSGVERVAQRVLQEMPEGFAHERIQNDQFADHHRLSHLRGEAPVIVLGGHLDTLCPPDSPFLHLTEEGQKLRGPGVCDMKGGLTVAIWALKVLEQCGLLGGLSIVCIFNADEEVGSPTSVPLFTAMGSGRASYALVFEPGGPEGTVVTTRKGVTRYRLEIRGEPAHFGCLKKRKISAVLELAHKVLAIESLNRPDGSLVANAGRVEGGLAANAVADRAMMDFELRYWTPQVEARAVKAVQEALGQPKVHGCRLDLAQLSYRPPLHPSEQSLALFERIREVGASLGQEVSAEKRGGVSDANWLSHAGIPTVDGLGPLGDLDFTPEEYIITETLFDRIELTAHVLLSLSS